MNRFAALRDYGDNAKYSNIELKQQNYWMQGRKPNCNTKSEGQERDMTRTTDIREPGGGGISEKQKKL
jgi:hypothetical protein